MSESPIYWCSRIHTRRARSCAALREIHVHSVARCHAGSRGDELRVRGVGLCQVLQTKQWPSARGKPGLKVELCMHAARVLGALHRKPETAQQMVPNAVDITNSTCATVDLF